MAWPSDHRCVVDEIDATVESDENCRLAIVKAVVDIISDLQNSVEWRLRLAVCLDQNSLMP